MRCDGVFTSIIQTFNCTLFATLSTLLGPSEAVQVRTKRETRCLSDKVAPLFQETRKRASDDVSIAQCPP